MPAVSTQVGRNKYNFYFYLKSCIYFRFCVGDQFYLLDNKILCGPDYEERMLFANIQNHPDRLAQLKTQTRLLPPSYPSHSYHSPTSGPQPAPQGYNYPCFTPPSPGPLPPKCVSMNPLPPISSVQSLSKRTALAM